MPAKLRLFLHTGNIFPCFFGFVCFIFGLKKADCLVEPEKGCNFAAEVFKE